jgi:radical SAM-linked protein
LIEPLFIRLANRYSEQKVALSLPSMRVETLTARMIEEIKRVRKTSFTLAPEAGTQRLRDIINKGNTEEDLLTTTRKVFEAGWQSIKLYFMLGLPGETEEDLEGITDLAYKCLRTGKNKGQVTVSLSTFVPKAHTPFQWQRQIGIEETLEKQAYFKKRLRHRNLSVKWHDSRMSLLEGIFARGDDRIGVLIEKAYQRGCRFDGWSDRFRFDLWEKAMDETGVVPEDYLRERDYSETLPWANIDGGVTADFLREEAEKSQTGELTADCRLASCSDCGACNEKNICIISADANVVLETTDQAEINDIVGFSGGEKRLRMQFAKREKARFLSHLEISTALVRAINRSGLTFIYSQGFHPHPKISFATATPVGMESMGEYVEMHVKNFPDRKGNDLPQLMERINAALPVGIRIIAIEEVPSYGETLYDLVKGFEYHVAIPDSISGTAMAAFSDKIAHLLNVEEFTIIRESKGKTVLKNIRPLLKALSLDEQSRTITMAAMIGEGGAAVRPIDILTAVLGLDSDTANTFRIIKTDTFFNKP